LSPKPADLEQEKRWFETGFVYETTDIKNEQNTRDENKKEKTNMKKRKYSYGSQSYYLINAVPIK
jgi:hypothetical protein